MQRHHPGKAGVAWDNRIAYIPTLNTSGLAGKLSDRRRMAGDLDVFVLRGAHECSRNIPRRWDERRPLRVLRAIKTEGGACSALQGPQDDYPAAPRRAPHER